MPQKFYADEKFPLPVVTELRMLGHDVLTLQEAGYGGLAITDETVLEHATQAHRALLTMNRKHFVALHHTKSNHAGIIVCSLDLDFTVQARRIDSEIKSRKENITGKLVRINRP